MAENRDPPSFSAKYRNEEIMGKKKFGIMGNGYLAGIIVDSYLSGILDEYQLVGVMGRTPDKTAALAERGGCKACGTVEELLALKPDIVAEAASVQCIKDNAETVLSSGADLIVLSIGAFADKALYDKIKETATEQWAGVMYCAPYP